MRELGSGAADPAAAPLAGVGTPPHVTLRNLRHWVGAGTRGLWEEAPARAPTGYPQSPSTSRSHAS